MVSMNASDGCPSIAAPSQMGHSTILMSTCFFFSNAYRYGTVPPIPVAQEEFGGIKLVNPLLGMNIALSMAGATIQKNT